MESFSFVVSSSFGHPRDEKEFIDVTLVGEGGQPVEAHKVVLAAFSIQTTIHAHWFEPEDFIFYPEYFSYTKSLTPPDFV